jgi:hypothetical protein
MPSVPQTIAQPDNTSETTKLGSASTKLMAATFADSPIHENAADFETVARNEMNGVLTQPIENGFGMPSFDPNYEDGSEDKAPDLAGVKVGAAGDPANPYQPNVASPGKGNGDDASKLPTPPESQDAENLGPGNAPFTGDGHQTPSKTSSDMKVKLGDFLTMGKSPASADTAG